jgi:hypothetical protein
MNEYRNEYKSNHNSIINSEKYYDGINNKVNKVDKDDTNTDTDTDTNTDYDTDIDDDGNEETYIIKANVCKRLSKELGLNNINIYNENENFNWIPPKKHGLSNSNHIIPSYYHIDKNIKKAFNIDYFFIIKDDIRNYRSLNKHQLEYIKKLSHKDKNEIFDIFNDCIISLNDILT